MRRREIEVRATSAGTPDAVFALLADGSTWRSWSPIETTALEREGDPPPEGVGAVRRHTRGRTTGRDETTEWVPGKRFAYRSLSGLPVRDYVASIDLAPADAGTRISWRASFEPTLPGTGGLLERGIGGFLRECVHGLARAAEAPGAP